MTAGGRGPDGERRDREPATRGQAHTLEGIIGGLLVLSALLFALQMVAVTPLTASTSSQHIENQAQATARGVLDGAAESGALRRAVLYWNDDAERFHDATDDGYYVDDLPANEFGEMLERSFENRGLAVNVYVGFLADGDVYQQRRMVYKGTPSDNAVSATRTVLLHNTTPLYDADGTENGTVTVSNATSFYAEDTAPDASTFNVVRVEVVAWRI